MPFHVVLVAPEMPQNAGNIIRLCANTGSTLHLVKPFSFELDDKHLQRASLDYRDIADVRIHDSFTDVASELKSSRIFATTASGNTRYDQVAYKDGDAILFGPERIGLSPRILDQIDAARHLGIPMVPGNRSLNVSNAAALVVYEMWRQNSFNGGQLKQQGEQENFS